MTEEKKNKTRQPKEPKSLEPRVQITYNDLRKGIAEEVNSKFNTPVIEAFSKYLPFVWLSISIFVTAFCKELIPTTNLSKTPPFLSRIMQ
jgi:hypothetical protein